MSIFPRLIKTTARMSEYSDDRIPETVLAGVEDRITAARTDHDVVDVEMKFYQFGLYSGQWHAKTSSPHGRGKWLKGSVLRYDGYWSHGKWTGLGTVYDERGIRVCTGSYLDGKLHGFATAYAEDGETIEDEGYHVFGHPCPDITNEEQFSLAVSKREEQRDALNSSSTPSTTTGSSNREGSHPYTTKSFSFTLNSSNPIMSAPIVGLFPRYHEVPVKMLEGQGFQDLDDDEVPTPTNLEEGKTRDDWLEWVRRFYPRRNAEV